MTDPTTTPPLPDTIDGNDPVGLMNAMSRYTEETPDDEEPEQGEEVGEPEVEDSEADAVDPDQDSDEDEDEEEEEEDTLAPEPK